MGKRRVFPNIGDKYERLEIIGILEPVKNSRGQDIPMVRCRCDCGNYVNSSFYGLRNGTIRSCGCLQKENHYKRFKKYNTYETDEEVTKVFDSRGNFALIDTEDLEKVKPYYFYKDTRNYFCSKGNPKMHQVIMGSQEGMVIDHINRDTTDNRKCNLRFCTKGDNNKNRKAKGYRKKHNKFEVSIKADGVYHYLGSFDSEEEAIKVRKEAEKKYFREFACK